MPAGLSKLGDIVRQQITQELTFTGSMQIQDLLGLLCHLVPFI
jgi:hypothetical protein